MGLRRSHFDDFLAPDTSLPDWVEVISENFMDYGGKPQRVLEHLKKKNIPIISHGVGLSIGSLDSLETDYSKYLERFLSDYKCPWFSDHLCFSSTNTHQFHDLLPVLRTEESLAEIVTKITAIEKKFKTPFAFENISFYGESSLNTMDEVDFINKILDQTNSYLLFDINNIFVNYKNHGIDPQKYIDQLNTDKVIQIHLAGHWDRGDIIIDTHGDHVTDEVWELYKYFIKKMKREVSTLIEWDNDIPDYEVLLFETLKAKEVARSVL